MTAASRHADTPPTGAEPTLADWTGWTVGWIHGGGPTWGRCRDGRAGRVTVEAADGTVELKRNDVAVAIPSAVAADARALRGDAAEALWHRLGLASPARPATVAELGATLGEAAPPPPVLWLTLWEHPELFARSGRARFYPRSADEVHNERQRLLRKRHEQRLIADIDAEARRLLPDVEAIGTWALSRSEVEHVLRCLAYGTGPEPSPGEAVERRIEHHIVHAHDEAATTWPLSWFAATALGDADPWRHGHPELAAHRRWLTAQPEDPPGPVRAPGPRLELATELWAVDDADTTDRDDAVGAVPLDGRRLLVEIAIADVTAGFAAHDELFAAIAAIGTTVYLPTRDVPMVPASWGAARHSLDPGTERPVLLLRLILDRHSGGLAAPAELVRGRVTIAGAAAYEAIDAGETTPPHWAALRDATELGAVRRVGAGADRIEQPEAAVRVQGGHPSGFRRIEPWRGARAVIRELMITANTAFAELLAAAELPAPYRHQGGERGNRDAVRVQPQPGAHRGLAAPAYVYATSPIRRAVDVLAQRQLGALLGDPPLPRRQLIAWMQQAERATTEMKRWMDLAGRYWKLRYLESAPETKLVAVPLTVPGEAGERVRVRVDPLALPAVLAAPAAPPGSPWPVRPIVVDAETGQFEVELCDPR